MKIVDMIGKPKEMRAGDLKVGDVYYCNGRGPFLVLDVARPWREPRNVKLVIVLTDSAPVSSISLQMRDDELVVVVEEMLFLKVEHYYDVLRSAKQVKT